jgi:hypothetical protein
MLPLNPKSRDERTIAERKWSAPKLAPAAQQPCDHGLFGDAANQIDLLDLLQQPVRKP